MASYRRAQKLEPIPESEDCRDDDDRSTTVSNTSEALDAATALILESEIPPRDIGFEVQNQHSNAIHPGNSADAFALGFTLGRLGHMSSLMSAAPMWSPPVQVPNTPAGASKRSRKKAKSLITLAAKRMAKQHSELQPFEGMSYTSGYYHQTSTVQINRQTTPLIPPQSQDTACSNCRHCGHRLERHFKFCEHCGKALSDSCKTEQHHREHREHCGRVLFDSCKSKQDHCKGEMEPLRNGLHMEI
jgi:hypothetical protein